MGDKLEDFLQSGQISSRAAQQMMTHEAERPNPARPYVQGAKALASGGLQGLANQRGIDTPEWSRRIGELMNSPEANAAIGAVTPMGKAAGSFIKAYHGSPHDFERFDMSKIGTGEGAQSYGHGLYFAESPEVAKAYREKLSGTAPRSSVMKPEILNEYFKPGEVVNTMWGRDRVIDYDPKSRMATVRAVDKDGNPLPGYEGKVRQHTTTPEWNEVVSTFKQRGTPIPSLGKTYEVALNAHPDEFLDWDKPMSRQSDTVKDAVSKVWGVPQNELHDQMYMRGVDADKSAALREAGIPGIKYLDQGSRSAGNGSRNYVVFDDNLVDVLRKYGMAGAAALPGLGAYHFQRQDAPEVAPNAPEQMPSDTQAAASYLK